MKMMSRGKSAQMMCTSSGIAGPIARKSKRRKMRAQPQAPNMDKIVEKSSLSYKEAKKGKKEVFKMMDECMDEIEDDCDDEDDDEIEIESKPKNVTHEVIFSILSYFIFKINQFPEYLAYF